MLQALDHMQPQGNWLDDAYFAAPCPSSDSPATQALELPTVSLPRPADASSSLSNITPSSSSTDTDRTSNTNANDTTEIDSSSGVKSDSPACEMISASRIYRPPRFSPPSSPWAYRPPPVAPQSVPTLVSLIAQRLSTRMDLIGPRLSNLP